MILERTVANMAELIAALGELTLLAGGDVVWFRGHSKSTFTLLPSLARNPIAIQRESLLAKRFKQNAYSFRQRPPADEWEWLFLMQHFGVPTRLLDWSETPLVGAYFAVHDDDPSHAASDGHIWALLPARYNRDVCRFTQIVPIDIPSFGDAVLEDYRPDRVAITPSIVKYPAAAIAPRQNERIMAQLGTFTIMHLDMRPLETIADKYLARFVIPSAAKKAFQAELAALRITRMTLFPELASVAAVAREVLV
jgi:hypothetical protein